MLTLEVRAQKITTFGSSFHLEYLGLCSIYVNIILTLGGFLGVIICFQVRKERLGDRITALHQIVSPFGKVQKDMKLQLTAFMVNFRD